MKHQQKLAIALSCKFPPSRVIINLVSNYGINNTDKPLSLYFRFDIFGNRCETRRIL